MNHIPNNDCISTKLQLLDTMRAYYCKPTHLQHTLISSSNTSTPLPCHETTRTPPTSSGVTAPRNSLSLPPWLPETYELEDAIDRAALLRSEESTSATTGAPGLWIYKPASSNRFVRSFYSLDGLYLCCILLYILYWLQGYLL